MMNDLDEIYDFLYGPGVPMIGREISDGDAEALAKSKSPHKPYCLVRNWMWVDLVIPDEVLKELTETGREPIMLYSHNVVYDSAGRMDAGGWVRSTPLVEFTDGCLFHTRNTTYVLIGNGVRKAEKLSTVVKIF